METKKDKRVGNIGCTLLVIALIIIVMILANIGEGLFYAISDGGWKWLLIVGGLAAFVFLVMNAAGD